MIRNKDTREMHRGHPFLQEHRSLDRCKTAYIASEV
nr:MAG TPA: hypothetical protein [Caudoviricetes sp.]